MRDEVGPAEGRAAPRRAPLLVLALLAGALLAGAVAGAAVSVVLDRGNDKNAASKAGAIAPGQPGGVAELVAVVLPSVVTVINEQPPRQDEQGRIVGTVSVGSGVVVDPRGFVLTNEHVIRGASKITIVLEDGKELPATLVSHDAPFTDIAVLRVAGGRLPALPFGDSDALRLGDPVVAIGSALFEYRGSVSVGIVSGLGRRWLREGVYMEDLIQTDAAINNGNSGGPLVNSRGEVVGVVTNVVRRLGASETVFGISFAISSKTFAPVVKSIIERGSYPRPYFGIDHVDLDEEVAASLGVRAERGTLVVRVFGGSPADRAGIRAGDIILRLGAMDLQPDLPFINALSRIGATDRTRLQILRDGRLLEGQIEFVAR
jgi:S1-C subfamily serine protease